MIVQGCSETPLKVMEVLNFLSGLSVTTMFAQVVGYLLSTLKLLEFQFQWILC